MQISHSHQSTLGQVYDVVVVGSGYAGFAAAATARRLGRSVLLIGPRGDLVWESGRAFCPDAGTCDDPGWQELVDAVAKRGGVAEGWLDGAIAEVVATDQLVTSQAAVLYYARPVAVERAGEAVTSLLVATKSGLARVAGRQWVDATESAELLRLIDPTLATRPPSRTDAYLFLQHPDWSAVEAADTLRPTAWPTERLLEIQLDGDVTGPAWRARVLDSLTALEEALGDQIASVSMSHLSIEPISRYAEPTAGDVTEAGGGASNVAVAVPGLVGSAVATLADRFLLGVQAVAELSSSEAHDVPADVLSAPLPAVFPARTVRTDVCVAGAGTGGALASVAAARTGASVACLEPLAFAGGIGTGGGIHGYYFGVIGGLQREVDQRTRELMKRFDGGPLGDGPFNPWAKMITLERLLNDDGVALHTNAMLFAVERDGDRVTAVLAATPQGVLRVEADAFIDGTGDGDLCALAGAQYSYGREHDGLLHAYTQSSGRLHELRGRPRMNVVNFDAGYCDATDLDDLTRARLAGIRQYLVSGYDNYSRPTYIAPAIGLRQARQITTEYVLTLDDQIRRRRFDDPIGYTGAHYDNHAMDYEFESDEAVFWVWANRQFSKPVACEMPYRMLLPRGLSNVWIASRCLGVSQDAHHITRMQRDMQRVGEAAGYAAATAVRLGVSSGRLPYPELRELLDRTGALDKEPHMFRTGFGSFPREETRETETTTLMAPELASADEALAALDRGEPGEAMWWLYRHESLVRAAVLDRLTGSVPVAKPMVGWLAACVAAMWTDPAAEPRLIEAIDTLEYGFGEGYEWVPSRAAYMAEHANPLYWGKVAPNWLCAVALLRRCGSRASLASLDRLVKQPVHGINTLTSVAITLESLVRREVVDDELRAQVTAILDGILAAKVVGSVDLPERGVSEYSDRAARDGIEALDAVTKHSPAAPLDELFRNTYQDYMWQLHLAVSKVRVALGVPLHEAALQYRDDPRGPVRREFAKLTPA